MDYEKWLKILFAYGIGFIVAYISPKELFAFVFVVTSLTVRIWLSDSIKP